MSDETFQIGDQAYAINGRPDIGTGSIRREGSCTVTGPLQNWSGVDGFSIAPDGKGFGYRIHAPDCINPRHPSGDWICAPEKLLRLNEVPHG